MTSRLVSRVLGEALKQGGDFAEILCRAQPHDCLMSLEDSRLERQLHRAGRGRIHPGDPRARHLLRFRLDSLDESALLEAARLAGEGLAGGGSAGIRQLSSISTSFTACHRGSAGFNAARGRRRRCCTSADAAARGAGAEIVQASVGYQDEFSEIMIANSEGVLAGEERTRVRMSVRAVGARDGMMQTGSDSMGAHRGMELFRRARSR